MARSVPGFFPLLLVAGLLLASPLLSPSPASAMGVGFSVGGASGHAEVGDWFWSGPDAEPRFRRSGVGFLLDTGHPGRVFGYRLELCAENVSVNASSTANPKMDIRRFSIQHTFGFAVFQNESVRVWLGPQALLYWDRDTSQTPEYASEGWGVGGAMGADFRLAPPLSLGVTTGIRKLWGDGSPDISYNEFLFGMNLVFHFGER